MTNNIQLFNYGESPVRTIMQDGEVWFVAKDVCDILDIKNSRDAVSSLDDDERITSEIPTPSNGGRSKLNFISESGLYTLIFKSIKPEAKAFRKWVTGTVLPTIRKTGSYSVGQPQPQSALPASSLRSEIERTKQRIAFIEGFMKVYMDFEHALLPKDTHFRDMVKWPEYMRDDRDDLSHMAAIVRVFKDFALDKMRNLEKNLAALETLAKF